MKAKMSRLTVVALHIVVLAGFSLMQGCTTGKCPISWLNWPYSTQRAEPVVVPAEDYSTGGILPAGGTAIPSAPAAGLGEGAAYRVQKGDTLSSIASMYGTSWKKLADYNSLSSPNKLKIGQEIRIPGGSGSAAPVKRYSPPARPAAAPAIKQGSSYVIQKGDMLSTIAKRSGLTVAEIKTANSLTSDRIVAGKSLTIPKKGEIKAPAPAAAKPAPAATAGPVPAPAPIADATPSTVTSAVPAVSAAPSAAPAAAAASAPVYEHVLYPGETLDDVARQYGSTQQDIMKLNNITDPASIKPGTKLLVPIPE
jgi:LysM repeat protein